MAMPQVHIVAYCGDLGDGVARGTEMLSLMMAFGVVSLIGSGFLADRIGGIRTLLIGSAAQGFALLFFLFRQPLVALRDLRDVRAVSGRHRAELRHHRPRGDAGAQAATRVGIVIFASVFGMSFGGWASGVIFDATAPMVLCSSTASAGRR